MANRLSGSLTAIERLTLATYERSAQSWFDARNEPDFWAAEFAAFRTLSAPGRVLDGGSGGGRDARMMSAAGLQVVGVDVCAQMTAVAQRNCPAALFVHASLYALPFAEGAFDAAWLAASLLHLPKPRARSALREVRRVLSAGAAMFVAVKQGEGERLESGPHGQRFFAYYTAAELRDAVCKGGFRAVETPLQGVVADIHPIRRADVHWLCAFFRAA